MNGFWKFLLATMFTVAVAESAAQASTGGVIFKAISRYFAKETAQESSELVVKQMTTKVGEELIERISQKVIREGGAKSLEEVGELVAKYGPEVIRALDNAPEALPIIKSLKLLPPDEIGKVVSRLAAGSTGRELAVISNKLGSTVLRAEAKHPGVGLKFAQALGDDGAQLSMKLTTDQAIQIGRHVDEIAQLPKSTQSQLLTLIETNTERFTAFLGRFIEKNPGKVLFTSATTGIVLANAETILGDGEIVFDASGNPVLMSNGETVRHHPGFLLNVTEYFLNMIRSPLQIVFYLLGGVLVLLAFIIGSSKIWKHIQKDRIEVQSARMKAISAVQPNPLGPARTINSDVER